MISWCSRACLSLSTGSRRPFGASLAAVYSWRSSVSCSTAARAFGAFLKVSTAGAAAVGNMLRWRKLRRIDGNSFQSNRLFYYVPVATLAQSGEQLVRLLVWIGGVGTTVAGSWISSKIHNYHEGRAAHLEEIKHKVLIPIREGLENFRPILFHQTPVVSVGFAAKNYRENARVTEVPIESGPLLVAAFPGASIVGGTEPALLEDARSNHFRELMAEFDGFVRQYSAHSGELHVWVAKIAKEILERSGLPEFPNRDSGSQRNTYVMHYHLAVFV